MIERDMACAVCGHALIAIDHDGQITFEHPATPSKITSRNPCRHTNTVTSIPG
ncbi:hypothetical protein [Virgisporangium aurantiacum]|uniref:hypothetical protein n=1 Tax=Virgisporangium aurantiacum TaxID=175570 RepID=UPI001EF22989|nr:hypothetical protein [Virgisporangium aurantiacum]